MSILGITKSFSTGTTVRWCCHTCGRRSQTAVKYFRYLHLFRLPVLPLGSGQGLRCDQCERVELGRAIHDDLRHLLQVRHRNMHRPVWHFAGILLLAGVIVSL